MNEVVLIILFNHKFERNLSRLRHIYSGRFDHLYFIMPFYTGDDDDVIPVYENSFYFQGYIAQALLKLKNKRFKHYMIIGDDLILNPLINQENYSEYFRLDPESGFIPAIFLLDDDNSPRQHMQKTPFWHWNHNALNFNLRSKGIEVEHDLPAAQEAKARIAAHGYRFNPVLKKSQLMLSSPLLKNVIKKDNIQYNIKEVYHWLSNAIMLGFKKKRTLQYPMVGSYSDIVIIPNSSMDAFSHYCGVFAALNLFVEIAIPTSLLLAVKKITQEKDLDFKGITLWEAEERKAFEQDYNRDFSRLLSSFPGSALYIHPIKLSGWK